MISQETLEFHYGKHHNTYVTNLNNLVPGTDSRTCPRGHHHEIDWRVFNNAARVEPHLLLELPEPERRGAPTGALADAINKSFGSFDAFKEAFSKSAATNFGSGWTWLVKNAEGGVEIVNTSNAATPMTDGKTALLTIDVWEHAYYIDYRNARPKVPRRGMEDRQLGLCRQQLRRLIRTVVRRDMVSRCTTLADAGNHRSIGLT